jgi:hypothetical protein
MFISIQFLVEAQYQQHVLSLSASTQYFSKPSLLTMSWLFDRPFDLTPFVLALQYTEKERIIGVLKFKQE